MGAAGARGRDQDGEDGQAHERERDLAGPAPAALEEAARREDHQQHGHGDRQERAEPVEEPERAVHGGQRVVGADAVPDVGLGERVEHPEHAQPRQRPAEPLPDVVEEHDRGEPGEQQAEDAVAPAVAGRELDPGAGGGGGEVEGDRQRQQRGGQGGQHQQRPVPLQPSPDVHRDIVRPARPRGGRTGQSCPSRVDHAVSGSRCGAAVADGEADGGDQQPEHAGDAGHVLQRRDAEQSGEPTEDQADEADPAGHDALAGGREQGEPGEAGEHPEPRDGADPVVVHRGVGVVDDPVVLREAPSCTRCPGRRPAPRRPRCRPGR